MPWFQTKPRVFQAFQYLPGEQRAYPAGVHPPSVQEEAGLAYVVTAHGQRVYLTGGEWIVREPNGDGYYPIKADIFPTVCDPIPDPEEDAR